MLDKPQIPTLVLGGVRSGKSRFAQHLAERASRVAFLATAERRDDVLQAREADPVGAALVFLHLLEGQPQRVPQPFLRHPQQRPPQPHTRPDMNINRAWPAVPSRRLNSVFSHQKIHLRHPRLSPLYSMLIPLAAILAYSTQSKRRNKIFRQPRIATRHNCAVWNSVTRG